MKTDTASENETSENNVKTEEPSTKTDTASENKITDGKVKNLEPQEVDGILSACTVTAEEGQLYRLMIQQAGYTLNSSTVLKKHHCQPDVDIFLQNGFFQTVGEYEGKQ